jgi:hypothetical protein
LFRKNRDVKKAKFSAGDSVKIQSKEKIYQSLNSSNKLEGCFMMEEMWQYCGQHFKVLKVINNFFDEYQYRMYKPYSPLYILDGLICGGVVGSFGHRCDRSCYLLWHEEWLEGPQG